MPITQDRMLALIDAADDYKYALEGLVAQIEAIRAARASGQDYREPLAFLLQSPRIASMLHDPVATATTLATERAHFKAARGRNIRHAEYLRRKRTSDSAAIMTDEQAADYEALTGVKPGQPATQPPLRPAPLSVPKKPESVYGQYNMHDDGDPEDFAPQAQRTARDLAPEPSPVPNRRPFTGPDFVEAQAEPATKESRDGNE